jgi:hypothetical protein
MPKRSILRWLVERKSAPLQTKSTLAALRQWRSLSCNPRKNFFLSVNYLTLLDRFRNDAA